MFKTRIRSDINPIQNRPFWGCSQIGRIWEWEWEWESRMGLILGMVLKFDTRVAKGLNLKFRKFEGLIPTFVEATEEKLVGSLFAPPS